MAIAEACQVWIDQRIDEELEGGNRNPHQIGKIVAKEILKYFETEVKPHTLEMKVHRHKQNITNVSSPPIPSKDTENQENQVSHGGKRKDAGRKPKYYTPPKPITPEDRINIKNQYPMSDVFRKAYDNMIYAIKEERDHNWTRMEKESIYWHLETFHQLLGED